ncbi:MAG: hypothetical protein E7001_01490 [Coriobacteriaceae bacterium]|nr:hypothetical protein [Coriobacteriaceae bacterium]
MWPWIAAWSVVLVACTILGVVTRVSYTDVGDGIGALPYAPMPYSNAQIDREAELTPELIGYGPLEGAEAVLRVERTGERRLVPVATLTRVRVTSVLAGDGFEPDDEIELYEPIGLSEWDGGRLLVPEAAYRYGGVFMREGAEYLVFVNRADPRRAVPEAYTLAEHPFAKIPLSDDVPIRICETDREQLPISEYEAFDLLAADEASGDGYLARRDEVLAMVGLEAMSEE